MTENHGEIARWQAEWQAEGAPLELDAAELRRRVRRRTLGLAFQAVTATLLTAGGLGALAWVASRAASLWDWLVFAGFAVLLGAALAMELGSLRGLWRPAHESTAAFLELAIRRCRRRLWTLRVGFWVLAGEWLLFATWIHLRAVEKQAGGSDGLGTYLLGFGLLAILSAAYGLIGSWLARRARREMAELEEMRRGMEDAVDGRS